MDTPATDHQGQDNCQGQVVDRLRGNTGRIGPAMTSRAMRRTRICWSTPTRAPGAKHTFFVTNGTSTANKIVHQALLSPDDLVLADRSCHKSHHHAVVLTGARPAHSQAYPRNEFAFHGAVSLSRIEQLLLDYRARGRLLPAPDAKIRVDATQSTYKTLTAL